MQFRCWLFFCLSLSGIGHAHAFGGGVIIIGPGTATYSIPVTLNPPGAGGVVGPSSALSGATVYLHATNAPYFVFSHWNFNEGASNETNPVARTVTGNLNVRASFVPGMTAEVIGIGMVDGIEQVGAAGQWHELVAVPGRDSDFAGWYENGVFLSMEAVNIFPSEGSARHFVALFVPKPVFRITLLPEPWYGGGFIHPHGSFNPSEMNAYRDWRVTASHSYFSMVELRNARLVVPYAGFELVGWRLNDETFSPSNPLDFVVADNDVLTGIFQPIGMTAYVSFESNVTQTLHVPAGTNLTIICREPIHYGSSWHRGRRLVTQGYQSMHLTDVNKSDSGVYRLRLNEWIRRGPRLNRRVVKHHWSSSVKVKVYAPTPPITAAVDR